MRQRVGILPEKINQLAPSVNPGNDTMVYTWQETSPDGVVSTVIDYDGDFPDSIIQALEAIGTTFMCWWEGPGAATDSMPSGARSLLLSALVAE